ncbi:putative transcriptional regulator [Burkholderiales bacterium JOSHI_001]|nr:putative transcriptional regulator [Burkholderiales bacterium JOSHI_001]
MEKSLPAIPAKRYFTIGEVSDLCGVKPYVLRYWEQEFTQLKPMKRRGNRRYYQHHEVLLIRRIRDLLYDQGFTISGARNRLAEGAAAQRGPVADDPTPDDGLDPVGGLDAFEGAAPMAGDSPATNGADMPALRSHEVLPGLQVLEVDLRGLRAELLSIRAMLVEAV